MDTLEKTCSSIFDSASAGTITKDSHLFVVRNFIDELAKKIENIRETSIHDVDAKLRLEELSKRIGISITTLWKFYDRS